MTKSISIVIPNYNGVFLLKKNIPYIYRALKTSNIEDFEIIVYNGRKIKTIFMLLLGDPPCLFCC